MFNYAKYIFTYKVDAPLNPLNRRLFELLLVFHP